MKYNLDSCILHSLSKTNILAFSSYCIDAGIRTTLPFYIILEANACKQLIWSLMDVKTGKQIPKCTGSSSNIDKVPSWVADLELSQLAL